MSLIDHKSGCAVGDGVNVCTCGALNEFIAGRGGVHPSAFIHPLAHVDGSCGINADVKVWQFASVTRGTVLGPGCSVAPFAVLDGPKIGARSIISMHVAMGPGFEIGDDVFVGPNVTLCNDAWPRADKTGWDAEPYRNGRLVSVVVEDGASIGANAVILPGVTLGKGCMVAAGAVCGRDVPAEHLLRRDGQVVPIHPSARNRMKAARVNFAGAEAA